MHEATLTTIAFSHYATSIIHVAVAATAAAAIVVVVLVLAVVFLFVCVEVLRPSQPNGVMSSAVSLPSHTFTGQA